MTHAPVAPGESPDESSGESLWLDGTTPPADDPLPEETEHLDDVVVGAGITGLTTAVMLARAGRRVAVLEARTVGAVTTGHTTGKVSLLQGRQLSRIRDRHSREVTAAYLEGNREGQAWLARECASFGVPVQTRTALTYATRPIDRRQVLQEHDVALDLGLPVRWIEDLDVPFQAHGATALDDQLQLDPMPLLHALVEDLRTHGGTLHQGQRVVSVPPAAGGRPVLVGLEGGTRLRTAHVVLATGTPILDRGLDFAMLEPQRSYVVAVSGASAPEGMYLGVGSTTRSVRDAGVDGERLLLLGGSGHPVGRTGSEAAHLQELRTWAGECFPGGQERQAWSAQDYGSHDALPHVGTVPWSGGRVHVATGYDKWGLTNAVMAARIISGRILGAVPPWAQPLLHRGLGLSGVTGAVRINLGVGREVVRGLGRAARPAGSSYDGQLAGRATVGREGLVPTGRTTEPPCAVVALCTHLGGVLEWNDAEGSWDCPLHGSRFTPEGTVLEGPATRPLRARR